MRNKRLVIIVLTSAILLIIPIIAMQLTDEVSWTMADFAAGGVLLLVTGLLFELAIRKIKNIKFRVAVCAALIVSLIIIWVELAVGMLEKSL